MRIQYFLGILTLVFHLLNAKEDSKKMERLFDLVKEIVPGMKDQSIGENLRSLEVFYRKLQNSLMLNTTPFRNWWRIRDRQRRRV